MCVWHYNVITANATLSVRCKMYENYSQASLALSVQRQREETKEEARERRGKAERRGS